LALELPPVIGHRGAAALAPENTLAGLRAAATAGARWVEFDVKLTADDVCVLMHDETLDRTTDGQGRVAETPLAALRRLDAGRRFAPEFAGERVPTLVEAIGELERLGLGANIEIKPCAGRAAETARATVAVIAAHWPRSLPAPLISSFQRDSLATIREVAPDLPCGLIAERLPADWRDAVATLGCRSLHLGYRKLTPAIAAEVLAAGLKLAVWTVNDAAEGARWRAAGAHAIITDRPDALTASSAETVVGHA
jgi:glycerophosphoryl diester phosphodiesterase